MTIQLYNGDCLEIMPQIPSKSVDMILCDLPYGTTACKWDTIIPFEPLWKEYERIAKDNAAIVLTASQPFTSKLVASRIDWYKHHWVWVKEKGTGFQVAKHRPMMKTEDIIAFSKNTPRYNPQFTKRDKPIKYRYPKVQSKSNPLQSYNDKIIISDIKYPENVITIPTERGLHPTQKPVALFEYLIKTYTNEGDTVMDNCMGSGTTGVSCLNLDRNFIGIEKDPDYFQIAKNRIESTVVQEELKVI